MLARGRTLSLDYSSETQCKTPNATSAGEAQGPETRRDPDLHDDRVLMPRWRSSVQSSHSVLNVVHSECRGTTKSHGICRISFLRWGYLLKVRAKPGWFGCDLLQSLKLFFSE
jgi:hypothetical protein